MTGSDEVLVNHDEGVCLVTINRPKALNALNASVISGLQKAFSDLPESTRVVLLTGAGDRAFVAGADIKAMSSMTANEAVQFSKALHQVGQTIEGLNVPVIAVVNGFALGGGCELLLACDFALASDLSRFGQPEVGLGVIPGFGGTTRLTRRIGDASARQLVLTGAHVDAKEALRLGLVNEVVPGDQLMPRAQEVAAQIARNAPLAVQYAKQSLRHGEETDLNSANQFERHAFGLCFATEDQKEGMAAFIEKRTPKWRGA